MKSITNKTTGLVKSMGEQVKNLREDIESGRIPPPTEKETEQIRNILDECEAVLNKLKSDVKDKLKEKNEK